MSGAYPVVAGRWGSLEILGPEHEGGVGWVALPELGASVSHIQVVNNLTASSTVPEVPAEPLPWVGACLNSGSAVFPGKASVDYEI